MLSESRSNEAEAAPSVAGILFDEDGSVDPSYASEAVCITGCNT